ncbi:type III secretion system outer membrane ring subunit SctC [Trinickia caryophylli]|uniref:Type 3 secretion system secretin n=1 Tax=Trinickia caryophylli TaxID=28094 RepID=A0A1X7EDH6_TRICW|nr:type III secretion system outer membrane ring subunit SctC [Trinickia caryophylli]PMS12880.1 EscC/YscC/HrcC family type III secretion system outer membrane ring protein [Trinickia caryophylli]TRX14632.1 EscC/YscC/HrcC family type III secretion system outer membrane ring protein [Trinickia caryophylli]WQE14477.1 type III secretion system outer membrane ring subunit SctC [Trinickia caryophylli]SMF32029.1 type III secretion protein C [Trinickia caryophylli]GLU32120.1 EscC/YscC/HrcC family type
MPKNALSLLFILIAACAAAVAHAAPVNWHTRMVDYTADSKDIKDVLRDFAASQGIPADISKDVQGTVTGKFHMPPQRLLDTLASSFGFVWYYDGQVLDIVTPDEMKSTLIKLDHSSTTQLRSTLAAMNVTDPRFKITYDDVQGAAIVNGPPNYVKLVGDVAQRLDSTTRHRAGTVVQVYPLHHAWAMDRAVVADGQSINLPGVATVLANIYHPQQGNSGNAGGSGTGRTSNVQRAQPMANAGGSTRMQGGGPGTPLPQGTTLANGESSLGVFAGLSGRPSQQLTSVVNSNGPGADAPSGSSDDETLPVIEADQRTNSVLIRDTPDRMYQYPALIQRLDVKPCLIEIEAHIFEVDTSSIRQLGVSWTAHNSHMDIQTGNGLTAQNTYGGTIAQNFGTTTLSGNAIAAATPAGGVLSAVIGNAGRYLMANVSALEERNLAKIEASPKVTTLDNIEADMANQTQFFVRVSGYTSAELYSVSTGVSLRVLPMVVNEAGRTQIKLDVAIQDGQLSSRTVDNIPVISSTNINTSAFVNEGEALLIAGYKAHDRSDNTTGVPLLSKIPVIGNLFKYTDREDSRMERLFLLTPRIIEL